MRPPNGSFQNGSLSLSPLRLTKEKRKRPREARKVEESCSFHTAVNYSSNETPQGPGRDSVRAWTRGQVHIERDATASTNLSEACPRACPVSTCSVCVRLTQVRGQVWDENRKHSRGFTHSSQLPRTDGYLSRRGKLRCQLLWWSFSRNLRSHQDGGSPLGSERQEIRGRMVEANLGYMPQNCPQNHQLS